MIYVLLIGLAVQAIFLILLASRLRAVERKDYARPRAPGFEPDNEKRGAPPEHRASLRRATVPLAGVILILGVGTWAIAQNLEVEGKVTAGTVTPSDHSFMGKVGIGTTNPGSKLSVHPDGGSNGALWYDHITDSSTYDIQRITINAVGSQQAELYLRNGGTTANEFGIISGKDLYLATLNAAQSISLGRVVAYNAIGDHEVVNVDLFVQGTTGNVGIGTTAPQAKLDVNGAMKVNGPLQLQDGGTFSASYGTAYRFSTGVACTPRSIFYGEIPGLWGICICHKGGTTALCIGT